MKPYPMDRLICGDVGFGKTEIAIRAAFKSVVCGKQVAVLVPTTILALQHFQTFNKRLREFGVTVDYLNRFRSAKEKKEIFALKIDTRHRVKTINKENITRTSIYCINILLNKKHVFSLQDQNVK